MFSGVKFRSTSFNHDGSLFFLAISVFLDNDVESDYIDKSAPTGLAPSHPKVIYSKISPPVLVNSRKINTKDSSRKVTLKQLFTPFDTQQLTWPLYIRSNKAVCDNFEAQADPDIDESNVEASRTELSHDHTRGNAHWEAKIGSDITSFVNYFCAQNIRSKIRHPLFLSLKFKDCISIYYNTQHFSVDDHYQISLHLHNELQKIDDSELKAHNMI